MILFVSKDLETIMHQRYKILLTPKRHPIVCVYGKYIKKNPTTDNMCAKKLTSELETIFSFYAPLAGLCDVLKRKT